MAKSYVTKFTENMAQQRDILEARMKQIGLPVNNDMSINELTSLLTATNLDIKYTIEYERDPNFPDIDTLFDNDQLRAANGGDYKYCTYAIVRLNSDNIVHCPYMYYSKLDDGTYQGYYSKVYIGKGTTDDILYVVDGQTSSPLTNPKYTLTEEEISDHAFVGEDGFTYILARAYYNNDRIGNFSAESTGGKQYFFAQAREAITDTCVYPTNADFGTGSGNTALDYWRCPLSNTTLAHLEGSGNSINVRGAKMCRIDGLIKTTQIQGNTDNLVVYATQVYGYSINAGLTTSATSASSSLYGKSSAGVFISPNVAENVTYGITFSGYAPSTMIIRPGVTLISVLKSNYYTATNPFTQAKRVMLPSTIDSISGLALSCEELIIEPGAFGGSSTDGLNMAACYKMKKETLLNVFNNIADRTGLTARAITIPKFLNIALTDEEKAIATNKNWTISVGSN